MNPTNPVVGYGTSDSCVQHVPLSRTSHGEVGQKGDRALIVAGMSQISESTFQGGSGGRSFLSLLGIAVALVTAGVSLAMLMAGG